MKMFLHGKRWVLSAILMWLVVACIPVRVNAVESAGNPTLAESTETTSDATAEATLSWREVMKNGGWLMYVLGAMSVLLVAYIFFFAVSLRPKYIVPRILHRELMEKLKAGVTEDAAKACEYHPCPFSSVVLSALNYMESVTSPDPMLLKDVVEGEGARQADLIQGQVQYLLDLAVIAPMVGLLGTVLGMLRAFSSVAHDIANAKPVVLAEGVSQALITTAFGLFVGIPAMMAYAWFRRKASRQVAVLESASAEMMTALLGRDKIRPRTVIENNRDNGHTA